MECTTTKSNGSQLRQVYSVLPLQAIYSQILHENTTQMHYYQIEWKSIQASLFIIPSSIHSLSNTAREQALNAPLPNRRDFNRGMSIHHFILSQSLFNSKEAKEKLQLLSFNSPISITSKEGTFSISHTEYSLKE